MRTLCAWIKFFLLLLLVSRVNFIISPVTGTRGEQRGTFPSPWQYHFHLMTDCCCKWPTSWQGSSDNTQLMMRSLVRTINWHPTFMYAGPTWQHTKKVFQRLCVKGRRVSLRSQGFTSVSQKSVLWFCSRCLSEALYSLSLSCRHSENHWLCWVTQPDWEHSMHASWTCCTDFSCSDRLSKLAAL